MNQFADEIRTLNTKREDIENRKVTGHFIRAVCFEAQASADHANTLGWKKHLENALSEYKAIIGLRPDDLDALQGAVAQCHQLGDEHGETNYLQSIIAVAIRKKKPLEHARALRQSAAIINLRSSPVEWNNARGLLVTARRLVEHKAGPRTPEATELAETLLLYGDVQTKREKFKTARRALTRAGEFFEEMSPPAADAGRKRVDEALERLEEASGDKEAVGG